MQNPGAYVHSNIAGFVTLLETIRHASTMPVLVYASSSSVYGLNTKVPFSEDDRVDRWRSLARPRSPGVECQRVRFGNSK